MQNRFAHVVVVSIFTISTLTSLSSCSDFKRARSKRIVEKAFEQASNGDMEASFETSELAVQLGSLDWRLYDLRSRKFYLFGEPKKGIAELDTAIALLEKSDDPRPEILTRLISAKAQAKTSMGEYAAATVVYKEALKLTPTDAETLNNLAWLLATVSDEAIRDGKQAVEIALKACEESDWSSPASIDTLAAAYAEIGDFKTAVNYQKRTIEMLKSDNQLSTEQLKSLGFIERLTLFENGKPYFHDFVKKYHEEHPTK